MGLDDFSPDLDWVDSWWNSANAVKEGVSEKYKEWSKKAGAWIKRTRKDEKKAKKYDFLLANFLVQIILDKKYDSVSESIFNLTNAWYPSNYILGVLSLIYIDISNKIREFSKKPQIVFDYEIKTKKQEFNDDDLDIEIKNRINYWVEDIVDSLTIEYSSIQTEKLKILFKKNDPLLLDFTKLVFNFFLKEINISINDTKLENILIFILSEIEKGIDKLEIENI